MHAFADGPEWVGHIHFAGTSSVPAERRPALAAALDLLHLIAGSSCKAAWSSEIRVLQ